MKKTTFKQKIITERKEEPKCKIIQKILEHKPKREIITECKEEPKCKIQKKITQKKINNIENEKILYTYNYNQYDKLLVYRNNDIIITNDNIEKLEIDNLINDKEKFYTIIIKCNKLKELIINKINMYHLIIENCNEEIFIYFPKIKNKINLQHLLFNNENCNKINITGYIWKIEEIFINDDLKKLNLDLNIIDDNTKYYFKIKHNNIENLIFKNNYYNNINQELIKNIFFDNINNERIYLYTNSIFLENNTINELILIGDNYEIKGNLKNIKNILLDNNNIKLNTIKFNTEFNDNTIFELENFSKLTNLTNLNNIKNLTLIHCKIKEIPNIFINLKYLSLYSCNNINNISLLYLEKLELIHCNNIKELPNNLYNLKYLYLECCNNLNFIPDYLINLNQLIIKNCPKINFIPETLINLNNLTIFNNNIIKDLPTTIINVKNLDYDYYNILINDFTNKLKQNNDYNNYFKFKKILLNF